MLKSVFLADLRELLQREDPITPEMTFSDMGEWDSLAQMSCMAYFDKKFNVKTKIAHYAALRTVADLIALSGGAIT